MPPILLRFGRLKGFGVFRCPFEDLRKDERLIARTRRGEEVAFAVIYHQDVPRYEDPVYRDQRLRAEAGKLAEALLRPITVAQARAGVLSREQVAAAYQTSVSTATMEWAREEVRGRGPRPPRDEDFEGVVLRRPTPEDVTRIAAAEAEGVRQERAFCRARARELGLPMRVADVERIFGGDKIIFYFVAEGRIDFRGLVKDLAREFHARIEMKQIGVRDEAKLLGDLNICGQHLCCSRFLRGFEPVTMKMAKNQRTSLDPANISGHCGRLKCCLRYEDEVYTVLKKDLPTRGCGACTRSGVKGEVIAAEVLTRMVTLRTEKDERLVVPLADIVELTAAPTPRERERRAALLGPQPRAALAIVRTDAARGPLREITTAILADAFLRFNATDGRETAAVANVAAEPALSGASAERHWLHPDHLQKHWRRLGVDFPAFTQFPLEGAGDVLAAAAERLVAAGVVVRGEYRGYHHRGAARFLSEAEVRTGKYGRGANAPAPVEGEAWLFRVEPFADRLAAVAAEHGGRVRPAARAGRVREWLASVLAPWPVAVRAEQPRFPWPTDPAFQVTPWFHDACAVLAALGFPERRPGFDKFWPGTTILADRGEIIGAGVFLPALLLALGVDLPEQIVIHGQWRAPPRDAAPP
ncbi:MAG: hypothetical protein HY719_04535, partial [Planctomycetes bacterium]|nr:hypothetical protein [Planctomycetota bacterium]